MRRMNIHDGLQASVHAGDAFFSLTLFLSMAVLYGLGALMVIISPYLPLFKWFPGSSAGFAALLLSIFDEVQESMAYFMFIVSEMDNTMARVERVTDLALLRTEDEFNAAVSRRPRKQSKTTTHAIDRIYYRVLTAPPPPPLMPNVIAPQRYIEWNEAIPMKMRYLLWRK